MNTRNADTRSIPSGLRLAIHATMMAVKPLPPAVDVDIVWLAPLTMTAPARPQIPEDMSIVRITTFLTLIPA